jgi:hypothetical protein
MIYTLLNLTPNLVLPTETEFLALDVKWSPTGSNMILSGQSAFCLAWPLPVQGEAEA